MLPGPTSGAKEKPAWSPGASYVRVPPGVLCQDEAGRLGDLLGMFRGVAGRATGDTIRFRLHVRNDNRERQPPLVPLKAVSGPGDHAEPVVTILRPGAD